MAFNIGDTTAATEFARTARQLDDALGNEWGVAYSTMIIGNALAEARDDSRDLVAARDHLQEAANLFERLNDRQFALIASHNQGWIYAELGDPAREQEINERSLATAREIGNAGIEADALAQLGMTALQENRLDDAASLLRESIAIYRRDGVSVYLATNLGRLAAVFARAGKGVDAARLLGAEASLLQQQGTEITWWAARRTDETLALLRDVLDADAVERARAEGAGMTMDEATALAMGDSG